MSIDPIKQRFDFARRLILAAGKLALRFYRSPALIIEEKGLQDWVSAADRAVENFLVEQLSRKFPNDSFVCEESGSHSHKDAANIWIIDPIDGTTNFTRGIDLWCISIGLMTDSNLVAGLVYQATSGELFSAFRNEGAFRNGHPIRVSPTSRLDIARIDLGFSFRRPPHLYLDAIKRLLNAHVEHARLGSAALGLAYVAAGRYDGYWEAHVNSWDAAGGLCLVQEAGGITNDFWAGASLAQGNVVLVSTPKLFGQLQILLNNPTD